MCVWFWDMSPGRFEDAVMDPRKLRYFLAVVDSDGFGHAAEHVHVTQSSLSQLIATLERMPGLPFFHGVGGGPCSARPETR